MAKLIAEPGLEPSRIRVRLLAADGSVIAQIFQVTAIAADGRVIAQSNEITIPPGEFRSIDFNRAALPLAGEPCTGRQQVRARIIWKGSRAYQYHRFDSARLLGRQMKQGFGSEAHANGFASFDDQMIEHGGYVERQLSERELPGWIRGSSVAPQVGNNQPISIILPSVLNESNSIFAGIPRLRWRITADSLAATFAVCPERRRWPGRAPPAGHTG